MLRYICCDCVNVQSSLIAIEQIHLTKLARWNHMPRHGDQPTTRELEIAELSINGYSCDEIALQLSLSPATIRTYLRNIYAKMDVSNIRALTVKLYKLERRSEFTWKVPD